MEWLVLCLKSNKLTSITCFNKLTHVRSNLISLNGFEFLSDLTRRFLENKSYKQHADNAKFSILWLMLSWRQSWLQFHLFYVYHIYWKDWLWFSQQWLKCADISSFFTGACLMAFSCRSELLFQRTILARSLKDFHLCGCEEQFIHSLNGADGGKCFWNLLKCKCKSSTLYPRISCNDSVWTLMIQKYVLSPSQPISSRQECSSASASLHFVHFFWPL